MNRKNRSLGRRSVLRTIGAGVVGGVTLTGTASAGRDDYGNGKAIGKFLNEEAMFKDSPIWDTGISNRRGEDEVTVQFDALTEVNIPFEGAPDEGPWGVEPRAVRVSPGTEVTWTWRNEWDFVDDPDELPPHYLTSFFNPPAWGEEFVEYPGPGGEYTYTFEEPGTYFYFCIPHGTPFNLAELEGEDPPDEDPDEVVPDPVDEEPEDIRNLFGQRGAVIVKGQGRSE